MGKIMAKVLPEVQPTSLYWDVVDTAKKNVSRFAVVSLAKSIPKIESN